MNVVKTVVNLPTRLPNPFPRKASAPPDSQTPTLEAARSNRAGRTKKSLETKGFRGFFYCSENR